MVNDSRMKCPKCGHHSLFEDNDGIVICRACGYRLSRGQAVNHRLFKLLRNNLDQRR